MLIFKLQYLAICFYIVLWIHHVFPSVHARRATYSHVPVYDIDSSELPLPTRKAAALHARKLVGENSWARLATASVEFNDVPFGNVVAYSGMYINESKFI